jgi:hypothetical protein
MDSIESCHPKNFLTWKETANSDAAATEAPRTIAIIVEPVSSQQFGVYWHSATDATVISVYRMTSVFLLRFKLPTRKQKQQMTAARATALLAIAGCAMRDQPSVAPTTALAVQQITCNKRRETMM